jgi:hypothetical protein
MLPPLAGQTPLRSRARIQHQPSKAWLYSCMVNNPIRLVVHAACTARAGSGNWGKTRCDVLCVHPACPAPSDAVGGCRLRRSSVSSI